MVLLVQCNGHDIFIASKQVPGIHTYIITYFKGCEVTDGYNCQTQNENLMSAVDLKVIDYGYYDNLKVYTFFHSE